MDGLIPQSLAVVFSCLLLACQASPPTRPALPRLTVDRDNLAIHQSCVLVATGTPIRDEDGNGVVHILGDHLTVELEGEFSGGARGADPDSYRGIGLWVRGRGVTLRGATVRGFRCAIRATSADGLVLEDCDVSDNFRQRLRSTPEQEAREDWLWPHANDDREWVRNYGAGICVEDSRQVVVRRCRARRTQNGLLLDRVTAAEVYDCDFSFLSGWGIALWRSSFNLLSRNALDFCVRGYSHGVYNRGQDSAGLLLFEQCSGNVIAENSVTHGGDGLFAFAGREALGQVAPPGPAFDHQRRGCNDNLIAGNDFSDAAAHGLELTFSFGNQILGNRLGGNAICGIWGGYSRDTLIRGNTFTANGERGYGLERGGVNIEHGQRNVITGNEFQDNACGVHLWWDPDESLAALPWARANGHDSRDNVVTRNEFRGDTVGLHLRQSPATTFAANTMTGVATPVQADPADLTAGPVAEAIPLPLPEVRGERRPVGARSQWRGRQWIVMSEWGPMEPPPTAAPPPGTPR